MNKSICEYNISDICKICEENPGSHSFKEIKVYDNTSIMYTCPADAKRYNDKEGILVHYRNVLDRLKGRKWIWIFDGIDFGMKQAMEIKMAIELAMMISNEYSENLLKIFIINETWHIKIVYNTLLPFLTDRVTKIIYFIGDIESKCNDNLVEDIIVSYKNNKKVKGR